jgi:hypothetical protein
VSESVNDSLPDVVLRQKTEVAQACACPGAPPPVNCLARTNRDGIGNTLLNDRPPPPHPPQTAPAQTTKHPKGSAHPELAPPAGR